MAHAVPGKRSPTRIRSWRWLSVLNFGCQYRCCVMLISRLLLVRAAIQTCLLSLLSSFSTSVTVAMGKGKLSLIDVRAIVKELRGKLLGLRVANIYHLSAKCFLLKLSGQDVKQTLLVESGARLHTTKYDREVDKMPSNFAAKLRKHLRLTKLEDVQQVGNDRIVDLQFGRGDKCHHLILEFYVSADDDAWAAMALRDSA
jgi:hypothetical protein